MEKNTLWEVLNKALEMEEKGYKFYKDISKKSINGSTKKTFDFLANSEILHIENIRKFCKKLKEKDEFPLVKFVDVKNNRNEDFNIFSKSISSLKEKVKPDDSEKKAYRLAKELESNARRYYKNMLKETEDKNLVKLLKFLIEEENKHYGLVTNMYAYVTDPYNWFMQEKHPFSQK